MLAPDWNDYKILGSGDGLKLERWKNVTLLRPDPQAIWRATVDYGKFDCHARYERDKSGGGRWIVNKPMPDKLSATVKTCAAHGKKLRILNLFAYTGASTAVLAESGAHVTHVDAAKGMVDRARQNCTLNNVPTENTRFIIDDCKKFVAREIKRGKKYDAVIMDPPSYGRGANGEVWRMEDDIFELVSLTAQVLESPTFFLINSYTTGLQPQTISNILTLTMPRGAVEAYEVCLPTECSIALPCGCSGLWRSN